MADQKDDPVETKFPVFHRPFIHPVPNDVIYGPPGVEMVVNSDGKQILEIEMYDKDDQVYYRNHFEMKGQNPFMFKTDFAMRVGRNTIHYKLINMFPPEGHNITFSSGHFNVR